MVDQLCAMAAALVLNSRMACGVMRTGAARQHHVHDEEMTR
jgi:hypothetical protein